MGARPRHGKAPSLSRFLWLDYRQSLRTFKKQDLDLGTLEIQEKHEN